MKRRILCLLMCIFMVIPCVLSATGCGDEGKEYVTDAEGNIVIIDESAITITLYGIKDDKTTDEAVDRVEAAINAITKTKYSVQVELTLYKESEYYEKLEEAMLATHPEPERDEDGNIIEKETELETEAESGSDDETETETETELKPIETFINANGLPEIVYPAVEENQVDIFLITDPERYAKYSNKGWLEPLTEFLAGSGKKLKNYINAYYFNAAKTAKGAVEAIPNNGVIGECVYLLLNRELVDKYYYDPETINSFSTVKAFLEDVMAEEEEPYVWMLNEPSDRFDILYEGTMFGGLADAMTDNKSSKIENVIFSKENIERMTLINEYTADGRMIKGNIEDNADKKIACAFLTASSADIEKYADDYYTIVYNAPLASDINTLDAMYAINSESQHKARAEEILSLLTTDKTIINLLAYGVEEEDYLVKDGIVEKIDNGYSMNYRYCGNSFMLMPSSDMDEVTMGFAADNWKLGKQNNLSARASMFLGYKTFYYDRDNTDPEEFESPYTEEVIAKIHELSKTSSEALDKINAAYTDTESYLKQIEDLKVDTACDLYSIYFLAPNGDSIKNQFAAFAGNRDAYLNDPSAETEPVEEEPAEE